MTYLKYENVIPGVLKNDRHKKIKRKIFDSDNEYFNWNFNDFY